MRGTGLINTGTSTPRNDDPCAGRGWNRQYHLWRRLLHRMEMTLALHSPHLLVPAATGIRCHGRCVSCPARLGSHSTGRGASLLSCGDVEANPGTPFTDWGEGDNAVLPDLVQKTCGLLGITPVLDAFATPIKRRFPAFWTKAEDAFAQAWDYPSARALWANPPFSRLDEVLTSASREGCLILVVTPEWSGPGYSWWTALCALWPKRWCFPEGRPVYLRGGTDIVSGPRWRTWAFLLDFRPTPAAGPGCRPAGRSGCHGPDGTPLPPLSGPGAGRGPHGHTKTHGHPALGQKAGEVLQEEERAAV